MVKGKAAFIVKRFARQHYTAVFNPNSGFFARIEDTGHDEPFWAEHGPELLDIAITNWCDRGCFFCYRKSNESGAHICLSDYEEIIRQAQTLHVFQVALGGGNPNQHPDFVDILRLTRMKYGIVPNYTTNGRGLTSAVVEATRQYCGAVAVSAYPPYEETTEAVERLSSNGITTNIHFILTSKSVDTAIEWLNHPPQFVETSNAIVFLNYKPVGRFADEKLLLNKSSRLEEFFKLATESSHRFKIGFDTCTITGLARFGSAPEISLEGCDAGRFSLFVSEKMEVYPCSFMVEAGYSGIPLKNSSLAEIWRNHPAFSSIRTKHAAPGCSDCKTPRQCLSGCPLFPQMNLCSQNCNDSHSLIQVSGI
ncbi:MAG: radical SAM/SPASM domain-containing protein [Terriglobales bacterium]